MNKREDIVNMSYLNSISNGDKNFILDLIDLFFEQIPDYQKKLTEFYENREWIELGRTAHKAKSAIIMMGMDHLVADLKNLEENAKEEKNIRDYKEIIVKFVKDTNSALAELKEIKEKII